MKDFVWHIIALVLAGCCSLPIFGSELDTVSCASQRVLFSQSHSTINPELSDNAAVLESLTSQLRQLSKTGQLLRVDIQAGASPEGPAELNRNLSVARAHALRTYLLKQDGLDAALVSVTPLGVDWRGLRDMVAASGMGAKHEVLNILDNTPVWIYAKGRIVDGRKKQLMNLNGGRTWNYMLRWLFPTLRNSCAVYVYTKPAAPAEKAAAVVDNNIEKSKDTAVQPTAPEAVNVVAEKVDPDTVFDDTTQYTVPAPVDSVTLLPQRRQWMLGLRTNLLYDALLVPNVGVEVPVGQHWALAANWMYGWWHNDPRHYYWRIYGGEVGARYYMGQRRLTGHHLGLYAGIFTYDFELGGDGIMGGLPGGTLWDRYNVQATAEYGYSLALTRRLNLDFTLGLGYIHGEYRRYEPIDGYYVWKSTHRLRYFGPTKAEISLVWRIGRLEGGDR